MKKEFEKIKLVNLKNDSNTEKEINKLKYNQEEIKTHIDNLVIQLSNFSDSSASLFLINKIESLNNKIINLDFEIKNLKNQSKSIKNSNINLDVLLNNLNKFNEEIELANIEQKQILLNSILDSIEWCSDSNKLIINYIGSYSETHSLNPKNKINLK